MKIFTFTQAREHLSSVLEEARQEGAVIRQRNGDQFQVLLLAPRTSPFDVTPVRTKVTTADILEALRESRERC